MLRQQYNPRTLRSADLKGHASKPYVLFLGLGSLLWLGFGDGCSGGSCPGGIREGFVRDSAWT